MQLVTFNIYYSNFIKNMYMIGDDLKKSNQKADDL